MKIERIQQQLQSLYRLDGVPQIRDFLIDERQLREILPRAVSGPQVLVRDGGGEMLLSVHISPGSLERVEATGSKPAPLRDFLGVAEEVSHFLYLSWNTVNRHRVRLLDVEIQGEIDKFLLAWTHYGSSDGLIERLFGSISFNQTWGEAAVGRYREANRLGRRFCVWLEREVGERRRISTALHELRALYRMGGRDRLARLRRY